GCNDTGAQKWVPQTDGTLKNPQSGKCLDASGVSSTDGTRLHLWTCLAATNQKWNLPG
ncbi:MAG TPA: ricin-type beta-trefoil lectin domain protein, partial [Streptomyces sp.]|uniref:ricin-type beta-trefoil lectin domain protein n=1 Tax=Streptomyces sp. TaxID=1931 RepID=UPI002B968DE7